MVVLESDPFGRHYGAEDKRLNFSGVHLSGCVEHNGAPQLAHIDGWIEGGKAQAIP